MLSVQCGEDLPYRAVRGIHWDHLCKALSTACSFYSLEKHDQDHERLRKHLREGGSSSSPQQRTLWENVKAGLPFKLLCERESGRANWRQRVKLQASSTKCQTTPEKWSGPAGLLAALRMCALAVWAAGLVTTSLVYWGELCVLGGRWTKVLWFSNLFLPRLLLNHLRVMLFILCCCDLGSFQSLWFYVWWFVTAGAKPLYWLGLFWSSAILPKPTLTQAYLFLFSFCLPGLSFKPSFLMSWDCQNNLLFFWKPHHVRVTTYSRFPPLPWGLQALVQK